MDSIGLITVLPRREPLASDMSPVGRSGLMAITHGADKAGDQK
jgi:hypothetical protein